MAKVTIAALDNNAAPSAVVEGLEVDGPVGIHGVIDRDGLSLRLHHLTATDAATLRWSPRRTDFCVYVLEGSADLNGKRIAAGGCFIVEHGGALAIDLAAGTRLAAFENLDPRHKHGGAVHYIPAEDVPSNVGKPLGADLAASALLADAQCPCCDLWLHANFFPEGAEVGLHSHSEDEIILVTAGEIVLGNRRYGGGTAIAVARNAIYQFRAGAGGMDMVNFRAGSPVSTSATSDRVIDEGGFFVSRLGHPPHTYVAQAVG